MSIAVHMKVGLVQRVDRALWEVRRQSRTFTRRFGAFGWTLLACVALGMLAQAAGRHQAVELESVQRRLADRAATPSPSVSPSLHSADGREQLATFENTLPAHQSIPDVVQNLLSLAEDEQLSIVRGEYRTQVDGPGGFLRYRMLLPVKGDAQAIYRFMQTALRSHKTLALESVQFKRERIESSDVEARIQWVLMTRLPGSNGGPMSVADAAVGGKR